ncbi:uncharacterized protein, partial [Mycetomoellerius zeteki]|uniref:uncharacterized protein n=1 Tax=Mycetomoellerius zeteki TaxID=64791 RepID=UPI00084E453E
AKHPHLLDTIDKEKIKLSKKRPNEDSVNNFPNKYTLERWGAGSSMATQKGLDKAILQFIVENIQPLSIVDSPSFINLIRIGLPSHVNIMCRKTLKERLCQMYHRMKNALEKKLAEIEIVATTADLWSKGKRSYLGITVHWINPETLERESAALACRRIKGKHTYDVLAQAISSVFLEYHIQNKVCGTTTDNGSNFVKAFQSFQKDEDEESINTEFHSLSDLLIIDDVENIDPESSFILPPHHRYASHTLNLIAVKDCDKALDSDAVYKKKYRMTFAKLIKLWNKQNQSTQTADKIKEICSVYLKTPVITRWNSTFDSVLQLVKLLKNDSEKINQCLDYCNLQRLTENEIKFLEEYCQIMEPLARALDIIQGETGMYMGFLLPGLKTLQEKMEKFNKNGFTHCQALITAIQEGLNKRFSTLFEDKNLIIASSLHPKFKLNWIDGEKKKQAKTYLEELFGIKSTESSPVSEKSIDHDDFFHFNQRTKETESLQEELYRFLKFNSSNVDMLNDYHRIKKFFIKYNTALPSSAPVERMFSIGGSIVTPQRGNLHDDTIEYQILLKINKNFY